MKNLYTILLCCTVILTSNAQSLNAFYQDIVNNVSAENILNDLVTYENFGVKEVGTTELTTAENWIVGRYQELGYTDIELQEFSYFKGDSNNIIVTKTGTVYPNTFLIIDGHYDTINGPGTNDNGSGTVLLLEFARLLQNVNTEYSIKFIHFSGEEDGLIGSSHYVDNTVNPENLDISLVFNIDEVGGVSGQTNNTIVCEEDRSNPPSNNSASTQATQILANCVELYSNLNAEISYAYASDYIPFENNGEIITGLFESNQSPYAHSPYDTLENMDPTYLTEVVKAGLGAALHFSAAEETLSISEVSNENIKIYPNPTRTKLHIDFSKFTQNISSLSIIDVLGKTVLRADLKSEFNTINTANLSQGLYVIRIKSGNSILTKKILID